MKDIVWSSVLSIGIDEIDEDHRKLVSIFNILNHAVQQNESLEYLAATLTELINCTVWHFSHEERLMLKYRYPDRDAHKEEHRELIETAQELQQEILQAHGSIAEDHIVALEHWLTEHILRADGRLGTFLAQQR